MRYDLNAIQQMDKRDAFLREQERNTRQVAEEFLVSTGLAMLAPLCEYLFVNTRTDYSKDPVDFGFVKEYYLADVVSIKMTIPAEHRDTVREVVTKGLGLAMAKAYRIRGYSGYEELVEEWAYPTNRRYDQSSVFIEMPRKYTGGENLLTNCEIEEYVEAPKAAQVLHRVVCKEKGK